MNLVDALLDEEEQARYAARLPGHAQYCIARAEQAARLRVVVESGALPLDEKDRAILVYLAHIYGCDPLGLRLPAAECARARVCQVYALGLSPAVACAECNEGQPSVKSWADASAT